MNTFTGSRRSVVLASLLVAACGVERAPAAGGKARGEQGSPASAEDADDSHHVRFDRLEVGQSSTYAIATAEYHGSSGAFSYGADTLVLEVVGHDDNGYRVRETYPVSGEVRTCEYYLRLEQNELRVFDPNAGLRSTLFAFQSEYVLPLADIAMPVLADLGMPQGPDTSARAEAALIDGELLGRTYPHLNAVIDKRLVVVDGPASMWIYSTRYGVVRAVHCGVEGRMCVALDLVPE